MLILCCNYFSGCFAPFPNSGNLPQHKSGQLFRNIRANHQHGIFRRNAMGYRNKVLIIEDDPVTREYLFTIISDGYEAITAENGKDAEFLINSHCPDVILLDLGLPDIDGIDVLQKVRKWSAVPVIVVSAQSELCCKVNALDKGADDYLVKPIRSPDELLARIRVALRHSSSIGINSDIAVKHRFQVGGLVIDYDKYRVYIDDRDAELTQNEFKLVAMLGQRAGTVLTYEEIIRRMWGPNARTDNQILRVNMANIRRKIEQDPAHPRYIFTENGVGYRMAEK